MPLPPDDAKQIEIEAQMATLLAAGYAREDLWVSASGRVLVDPDAGALEAYKAGFARAAGKAGEPKAPPPVPPPPGLPQE